jgi:hypothetical protein
MLPASMEAVSRIRAAGSPASTLGLNVPGGIACPSSREPPSQCEGASARWIVWMVSRVPDNRAPRFPRTLQRSRTCVPSPGKLIVHSRGSDRAEASSSLRSSALSCHPAYGPVTERCELSFAARRHEHQGCTRNTRPAIASWSLFRYTVPR